MLELEADYKVIELDYGFDNYLKNIDEQTKDIVIKQRNIILINVDENGNTKIEKRPVGKNSIITELKKIIVPNPKNDKMPATIEIDMKYSGKVHVNKNLLVLGIFDKKLDYEKYREIRNKIFIAFNEVRNEFSQRKFNKSLLTLIESTEEEDIFQLEEVKRIFPIRYTETVN